VTGDRPVSPQQAAQLLADLVFLQGRDPDLFDSLWPQLQARLLILPADFEWQEVFCPYQVIQAATVLTPLTDSPRPWRFHHDFATAWPADGLRN